MLEKLPELKGLPELGQFVELDNEPELDPEKLLDERPDSLPEDALPEFAETDELDKSLDDEDSLGHELLDDEPLEEDDI